MTVRLDIKQIQKKHKMKKDKEREVVKKMKFLTILFMIVCFVAGFSITEGTAGLVAHWSFDDQSDPGFDYSGNNNHAIPYGGADWIADGISGGAMSFDGIDGYLDAGNSASLDIIGDQITISAWVYIDDFSNSRGIVSKGGYYYGYRLRVSATGVIVFDLTQEESYSIWGITQLEANRWYHVAATYDGYSMKVYLNGVKEPFETERSGNIDHADSSVWIGHGDNWTGYTWSYPFSGKIDELRIYDHALSEAQIQILYLMDLLPDFSIDIKPGSELNSINPIVKGKIPVAILSTIDFYAPDDVETESLTFGATGDEESLAFCNSNPEDVNSDGLDDLVCHFFTQKTGFKCGDVEGILRGQTEDEMPLALEGSDSVRIVPSACKDQEETTKEKNKEKKKQATSDLFRNQGQGQQWLCLLFGRMEMVYSTLTDLLPCPKIQQSGHQSNSYEIRDVMHILALD